jgi:hypothetical protein
MMPTAVKKAITTRTKTTDVANHATEKSQA